MLEIYFKKISPKTTDLYSEASILPRSTQAASQICFSNPILTVGFLNNGSSVLTNQTATFKILWIKATA